MGSAGVCIPLSYPAAVAAGFRGMPAAVPVRGRVIGVGTKGATAPAEPAPDPDRGRLYCSRPGPCSRVRPLAGTGSAGWWWSTGWRGGPTGNPPVPLLRARQDEIPVVPGGHGGQPDPGGRQGRSAGLPACRPTPAAVPAPAAPSVPGPSVPHLRSSPRGSARS